MNEKQLNNDLEVLENTLICFCDITDLEYSETLGKNYSRIKEFIKKAQKEHIRELARKCIEYIKGNKIYKEDGYWKDLIFYLEKEQYGYFIKKVLNSFVYGVTCDFAYKMLEVLNKPNWEEKTDDGN